ncbi:MAG: type I-E CRISPR-associated protein Cas7/Cse4/CasC [Candidatus Limousia pullorum]|nr:type I-E CRISPR-associated protein Cas7/Cse4/CasC [Candidatus Limousia pullorum]
MNSLYVDIHVLQTVPPSCVNRDDTGSPKTAVYGGVTRARVSSQSWKHAMRMMFKNIFTDEQVGVRTKKIVDLIIEKLDKLGYEGNKEKEALKALENAGIKVKKDNQVDALFFMSPKQAEALAKLVVENVSDKAEYKAALKEFPSIDIALFGRMVASDPSINYDASAQVAHSISTHEVNNEYDYFTAVDDLSAEDNAGAGHLGTVEFNSSTLYRYATVNVRELFKSLGTDTPKAVEGFAKAFLLSMPTGKQNTFANRTVPDFAYITVREDQPVNLAGAFEAPVRADQNGYVLKSIKALTDYADKTYKTFVDAPKNAYYIGTCESSIASQVSMKQLMDELFAQVSDYCNKENEK